MQRHGSFYRIHGYWAVVITKHNTMKSSKLILIALALVIFLSTILACSSAKDVEERKNLMMPKKSEMSRNSRYKETEKRKTNKYKPKKSKKKSLF